MQRKKYERIVWAYADIVYRVALNYSKNIHDAEDVVQTVFLKLGTSSLEFSDEDHIRKWLIRVAVNECKDLCSSYWRKNVDSFETMNQEPMFIDERNFELYHALLKLPLKCRIVVHLFYYEGYSSKEIATLLKMKEATVRTHLTRARKLLREQLKEEWQDE